MAIADYLGKMNKMSDFYAGKPEQLAKRAKDAAKNMGLGKIAAPTLEALALQKVKSEKEAAMRELQLAQQTNPGTLAERLEQEATGITQQQLAQNVGEVQNLKQKRQKNNLNKLAKNMEKKAGSGLDSLFGPKKPQARPQQRPPQQQQRPPVMAAQGGLMSFSGGGQAKTVSGVVTKAQIEEYKKSGSPISRAKRAGRSDEELKKEILKKRIQDATIITQGGGVIKPKVIGTDEAVPENITAEKDESRIDDIFSVKPRTIGQNLADDTGIKSLDKGAESTDTAPAPAPATDQRMDLANQQITDPFASDQKSLKDSNVDMLTQFGLLDEKGEPVLMPEAVKEQGQSAYEQLGTDANREGLASVFEKQKGAYNKLLEERRAVDEAQFGEEAMREKGKSAVVYGGGRAGPAQALRGLNKFRTQQEEAKRKSQDAIEAQAEKGLSVDRQGALADSEIGLAGNQARQTAQTNAIQNMETIIEKTMGYDLADRKITLELADMFNDQIKTKLGILDQIKSEEIVSADDALKRKNELIETYKDIVTDVEKEYFSLSSARQEAILDGNNEKAQKISDYIDSAVTKIWIESGGEEQVKRLDGIIAKGGGGSSRTTTTNAQTQGIGSFNSNALPYSQPNPDLQSILDRFGP